MHPMTQFSIATLSLQKDSKFAQAYRDGVHKSKYWESYYEDSLDLVSRLPTIASMIYNNVFHNGRKTPTLRKDYTMSQNFSHQLGIDNKDFHNLVNHYLVLHSDHEGGNVSAHAVHLVGSALADPYLSFSAGLNGYIFFKLVLPVLFMD